MGISGIYQKLMTISIFDFFLNFFFFNFFSFKFRKKTRFFNRVDTRFSYIADLGMRMRSSFVSWHSVLSVPPA